MKALVWNGPYEQTLAAVEVPIAGAQEVLVAPALVGICGSDLTAHKGVMGIARPGAIRGHEFGGTIISSTDESLPAGSRVAVNPVVTCGVCNACRRGDESSCPHVEIVGVHRAGALGEVVAVPVGQVHRIPDSLDWASAASAEPLAQAIHDVELARRGPMLGRCLVIGGGTIGAWIVQVLAGTEHSGIHVVDRDTARHALLADLGATSVSSVIDQSDDARFDTVFDVVGIAETRSAAISMARHGGQVIAVGLGQDDASVSWFDLVRREVTVRGANTFTPRDYAAALEMLAAGTVSAPEHRRVIPLDGAGEAFTEMVESPSFSGKTFIAVDQTCA